MNCHITPTPNNCMTVPLPQYLHPVTTDSNQSLADALSKCIKRANSSPLFAGSDTTVGVENEFQVAVEGRKDDVDLAISILQSNYYKNISKRAGRGDLSPHVMHGLTRFLNEADKQLWENSWVRFPRRLLSPFAAEILSQDVRADKTIPHSPLRGDVDHFFFTHQGEAWLRVPISYVLKLSLADAVGRPKVPLQLRQTARKLMEHLISDNSSPEITSFVLSTNGPETMPGANTARETSRRFFFLQLLVAYANQEFRLKRYGQSCRMYLAPNPPARQKRLNDLISDQFYRELFLNPCLSGWNRGEEKKEYMGLCHRTLSRSQLNTIGKLKEAGIIVNNLVVLPNTSSTSLANNGTHITIGSARLTATLRNQDPERAMRMEKYLGDLVIKITEHFLPLFVTTCTAAPHRFAFSDFHPEKVLGYLPHELDYTHLRMLWRRWKKKADLRFCGHSFTPVGPLWIDRLTSILLRLRGDFLPDVRLLDYLIALHSVEENPALDGSPLNQERLKRDLSEMGVFDSRMAMYLPYRMRDIQGYGFSGFEGRHYSLFPDLKDSLALAVDLQTAITAMAYHWVLDQEITHQDIPDDPCTESERRQIFFATAIGLPTVFIRSNSRNQLLRRILNRIEKKRASRRYRGYLRVEIAAYQQACLDIVREANLKLQFEAQETIETLQSMLDGQQPTAATNLTRGIVTTAHLKPSPLHIDAATFNKAAEQYYQGPLCQHHVQNGLDTLVHDGQRLDQLQHPALAQIKALLIGNAPTSLFIRETGHRFVAGQATEKELHTLLLLTLLIIEREISSPSCT